MTSPAEPIQYPSEKGDRLRPRSITTSVSFHDLDGVRGAAITDVDASEDPPRTRHELRDLRVGPPTKGTTHRSPQHADTPDYDDHQDSEVSGRRKRLVLKIRNCGIHDALHRTDVEECCGTCANPVAASVHSATNRRGPRIPIAAATSTVTTFGIHAPTAACNTPL